MRSMGTVVEGERLERMQQSAMWDGQRLRNIVPPMDGLRDENAEMPSVREFLFSGNDRLPADPLPCVDPRPALQREPSSGLRLTWLGHSTVLVEIDGFRVITDPVWGNRASPFSLIGPKRFQPVPIRLRDLPHIDAIVISHDHYDHLDYPTIRALRDSDVPFITSLGVGAHLEYWGIQPDRITELDWWESCQVADTGLTVTAAPSQHFSGRGLKDRNLTLWSSMVIAGDRHKVFFSGDTGLTPEYQRISERLGPFDVSMLEVGAFHPAWGDVHLGPRNALLAHEMLGGGTLMPIHWGTFSLAMHAWDEPAETLLAAADPDRSYLLMPRIGEPVEPSEGRPATPWWRGIASRAPGRLGCRSERRNVQDVPWPLD
ncbi:MAG: MBL fold metallo-hydrolase [Pseudomonadota bacterium]